MQLFRLFESSVIIKKIVEKHFIIKSKKQIFGMELEKV